MKKIVYEVAVFFAMALPPVMICILHWLKPWKFRSFKKCALLAVELSLYSWVLVAVLPRTDPKVFANGAANAFALLFGWFYIWPFFIVVVCAYLAVRLAVRFLVWLFRSLRRRQASCGKRVYESCDELDGSETGKKTNRAISRKRR